MNGSRARNTLWLKIFLAPNALLGSGVNATRNLSKNLEKYQNLIKERQ